jgi:TolB-like protein
MEGKMSYSKPLIYLLTFSLIVQPSFASNIPALAIAEFQNNTGRQELEFLSRSIPDIVTTDLSRPALIKILERREINRIIGEHKLSLSGMVDERTAKEAGRMLGTDYIITGSFTRLGAELRIDVRLIDVESVQVIGFNQMGNDENVIHRLSESLTKYLTGNEISLLVKTPLPLYTEDKTALDTEWYKRWYVWGILGVIVIGVVAASSAGKQENTNTNTNTINVGN